MPNRVSIVTVMLASICHPVFVETAVADDRLTRAEIQRLIENKTVTWAGAGTQSYYGPRGFYRYVGRGRMEEGMYQISDGVVCVKFMNGFLRCDAWYRDGGGYYIRHMNAPEFRSPSPGGYSRVMSIN